MNTLVQKWGNSLGVRIPSSFARGLHLKNGSNVEIKEENGKLIIEPKKFSLVELLNQVNAENMQDSIETGASLGNEEW